MGKNPGRKEKRAAVERVCEFTPKFIEDLTYWVGENAKTAERLLAIIEIVRRTPFEGIGKPEPLKNIGSNTWSRRLTHTHRVVYEVKHDRVIFLMGRYHY
jgi:toxin YoeB